MQTRRSFLATTAATSVLAATNILDAEETTSTSKAMRSYRISQTELEVSRIAYGCATLASFDRTPLTADAAARAERAVKTAYDNGVNFFDLADHYGFFKSEVAFGEIMRRSPGLRNKIVIQSKCGVRFRDDWQSGLPSYFFDCSHESIVNSVQGSLRRLGTEHLDLLLLHYPDALVEPHEVAEAFDQLHASGKVRYFGVSNHTASQIELLRTYVRQPLVVNQTALGLARPEILADGLNGNRPDNKRVTGVIDYCRLHGVSLQAYSSLRGKVLNPPADATPQVKEAAQVIRQIADQKNTTPWAVALAWVLRHPANIIPIIGSTNPKHIADNCAANAITLNREEWYRVLVAAVGALNNPVSQ